MRLKAPATTRSAIRALYPVPSPMTVLALPEHLAYAVLRLCGALFVYD
ncbi:MAG: hypothetical protein ACREU2_03645 [Steroidobacteraceae bacterium]